MSLNEEGPSLHTLFTELQKLQQQYDERQQEVKKIRLQKEAFVEESRHIQQTTKDLVHSCRELQVEIHRCKSKNSVLEADLEIACKEIESYKNDHKIIADDMRNLKQRDNESLQRFVLVMKSIQQEVRELDWNGYSNNVEEKTEKLEEEIKNMHIKLEDLNNEEQRKTKIVAALIIELDEKKKKIANLLQNNDYLNDKRDQLSRSLELRMDTKRSLMTQVATIEGQLYELETIVNNQNQQTENPADETEQPKARSMYCFKPGFSKGVKGKFVSPLLPRKNPLPTLKRPILKQISPPKDARRVLSPASTKRHVSTDENANDFLLDLNE
ncbi:hypothetical protein P9112_004274 [Eukaryota sp. TZLM1-RC]